MKMKLWFVACFIGITAVSAQSTDSLTTSKAPLLSKDTSSAPTRKHLAIAFHAGTAGAGVHVRFAVSKKIALRVGYSALPVSSQLVTEIGGLKTDANLQSTISHIHLFAEWQPFRAKGFRLVGGAAYVTNGLINASLSPTESYKIGNITLSSDDIGKLNIDMDWKGVAPYFGLGLGKGFGKNTFNVNLDLGAFYLPAPQCNVTGTARLSDNQAMGQQLTTNLSDYRWWPTLQLNFNFNIK